MKNVAALIKQADVGDLCYNCRRRVSCHIDRLGLRITQSETEGREAQFIRAKSDNNKIQGEGKRDFFGDNDRRYYRLQQCICIIVAAAEERADLYLRGWYLSSYRRVRFSSRKRRRQDA